MCIRKGNRIVYIPEQMTAGLLHNVEFVDQSFYVNLQFQ